MLVNNILVNNLRMIIGEIKMSKEIEIRNRLYNKEDILKFFSDKKINIYKQSHQVDTYFDNPADSFFKDINHVNDWIRIRNEDGCLSFNYKHWLPEGAEVRTYCEEEEYPMNSKEDLQLILDRLGFKGHFEPIVIVDKRRTSFIYRDCEVSIDEVKNLGTFIEIEYKGNNKNITQVQGFLKSILKDISANIGPDDYKGHAYHLFLKNKNGKNS